MADLLNDTGRSASGGSKVSADDQAPVWFITGGSSGFGAATVRAALARGYRVAATARDARALRTTERSRDAQLLALDLDLRDKASIATAVERATGAFGRIDVLFNNAGAATVGAIEELTDDLLRDQLEVNVVGPLAVVRAVLPNMRQRQRGRILQMSSMGGRCAFPGLGAYHASKFALEGASIALAQEVAPLGVRVTLIEPGDFRTPVLSPARLTFSTPMPEYDETAGRARAGIASLNGTQPGDPDRLAEAVIAVAESADPPLQLALGPDIYYRLEDQLAQQLAELRAWAHVSLSTDFSDIGSPAAS